MGIYKLTNAATVAERVTYGSRMKQAGGMDMFLYAYL